MNGARGRSNNYLLDGTDMNDGYRNDPAINEAGVFGTPSTILPIDAVAEVNVLSNFEPEYGRNSGAVVNIVTKSGTNALHGTAASISATTRWMRATTSISASQPKAHSTTTSTVARWAAPIVKDKTFFYADYEGQQESGRRRDTRLRSTGTAPDGSLSRQWRHQSRDRRASGPQPLACAEHSGTYTPPTLAARTANDARHFTFLQ